MCVPKEFRNGKATEVPEWAIDKLRKAASRAEAVIEEHRTGWPQAWGQGSRSSAFIHQLFDYAKTIMNDVEEEFGVKFLLSHALPTGTSPIYYLYADVDKNEFLLSGKRDVSQYAATMGYGKWLDTMHKLAISSKSRKSFEEAYRQYLSNLIA